MRKTASAIRLQEHRFTPGDLKAIGGVSYRQQNDWATKGILASEREGEYGWRRFEPRDFFAALVCSTLRRRFGTSAEDIRWVQSFMTQGTTSHLAGAVTLMEGGLNVFLMTDLRTTLVVDSDIELSELFALGSFRGDEDQAFLFLKLNPLINRIMATFDEPIAFKVNPEFYTGVRQARLLMELSPQEITVLELLQDRSYRSITLHLKDGTAIRAEAQSELAIKDGEDPHTLIRNALKSHSYQSITVTQIDGKVKVIKQSRSIKLGEPQKPLDTKKNAKPR